MDTYLINPRDVTRHTSHPGFKDSIGQPYIPHPSRYDRRFRFVAWPVRSVLWAIEYGMIARSVMRHTWNSMTRCAASCWEGPVDRDEEVEDLFTHEVHHEHYNSRLPWNQRSWEPSSHALVVMIPGVNASPMMYKEYCDAMVADFPKMDFFTPAFARGINKTAYDLASFLLPTLGDYITKYPGNPVILISFSNGGRIAAYLDGLLKIHFPQTRLLFIGIGGAFLGTRMMWFASLVGLDNQIGDPTCVEELQLNSESCRTGLELMRRRPNPLHQYHFFCSTDDEMIQPFTSATPYLGQGEKHHVIRGVSHNKLLEEAMPEVLKIIKQFF